MMEPTEEEIAVECEKAAVMMDKGMNPFHGMTYVEGVRNALDWVIGYTEEKPPEE